MWKKFSYLRWALAQDFGPKPPRSKSRKVEKIISDRLWLANLDLDPTDRNVEKSKKLSKLGEKSRFRAYLRHFFRLFDFSTRGVQLKNLEPRPFSDNFFDFSTFRPGGSRSKIATQILSEIIVSTFRPGGSRSEIVSQGLFDF